MATSAFDQNLGLPLFNSNVAYFNPEGNDLLPVCFFIKIKDKLHLLSYKYDLLQGNGNGDAFKLIFMAKGVKDKVRLIFKDDKYDNYQAPFLKVTSYTHLKVSNIHMYEVENVPWLNETNCLYPFMPEIDSEGRHVTSIRITSGKTMGRKFIVHTSEIKVENEDNGHFSIKTHSKPLNFGGPFLDNKQSQVDKGQTSLFGVLVESETFESKKCIPIAHILQEFHDTKSEKIVGNGKIPYDIDIGDVVDNIVNGEMDKNEIYSFEGYGKKRGTVLIFNMKFYKNSSKARLGSEVDCQRLQNLFEAIGFIVRMWDDGDQPLTKQFIEKKITETLNENIASCIVFLMAHGDIKDETKRVVELSNGELYPSNQIFHHLFHQKLFGRPKICIVVACHGDKKDFGVEVNEKNHEPNEARTNKPFGSYDNRKKLPKDLESVMMNSDSDKVLVEAAYPGNVAARDDKMGTLYVYKFMEVFNDKYNIHSKDFLGLLRKTKTAVSTFEYPEYYQVPIKTDTMDKNFFLCPGLDFKSN